MIFDAIQPPDPSSFYQDGHARMAVLAAETLLTQHFDGCPCSRCEKCRLVLSYCS